MGQVGREALFLSEILKTPFLLFFFFTTFLALGAFEMIF